MTEFTKEMFISDKSSNHEIKKEDEIDSIIDDSMGYRYDLGVDFKSELELSNDSELGGTSNLSTLKAGNVSAGNLLKKFIYSIYMYIIILSNFEFVSDYIKHKIDQLKQEIEDLKDRKSQQDFQIANIENINLRERFISLSNNLLTEQLEKEQQVYFIYFYLRINVHFKPYI